MLFFLVCAATWALRVPVINGMPISFNSDEPSHFLVVRYIAQHWQLPPYTREFYESAHPPLSDFVQAVYVHLWPESLWVYALRFLSCAFGLLTLWVIYKTARLIVSTWTAAFTTCFVAALPMFVMLSSSVTNDSFAVLLSSAILYLLVKGLRNGMPKRELNILCFLIGFAGITKYTLLGLLPVGMGVVIYDRRRSGSPWLVPVCSIAATFVLISGWWYLRNEILYGDPFRSKAEAAMGMFTGTGAPTHAHYWFDVCTTLCGSFLGMYPSFPNWPNSIYEVCVAIVVVVMLSSAVLAVRRGMSPIKCALGCFLISVLAVVLQYQFNHFEPHARLLFPAIFVISLGIASLRHVIPDEKRSRMAAYAIAALSCLTVALVLSPI